MLIDIFDLSKKVDFNKKGKKSHDFFKKVMIFASPGENFLILKMVQNVPANNVFKKFTGNTSQRNCSVVYCAIWCVLE